MDCWCSRPVQKMPLPSLSPGGGIYFALPRVRHAERRLEMADQSGGGGGSRCAGQLRNASSPTSSESLTLFAPTLLEISVLVESTTCSVIGPREKIMHSDSITDAPFHSDTDSLSADYSKVFLFAGSVGLAIVTGTAIVGHMVSETNIQAGIRQAAAGGSALGDILYAAACAVILFVGVVISHGYILPYAEVRQLPPWLSWIFTGRASARSQIKAPNTAHVTISGKDAYNGICPFHWSLPWWCHAIAAGAWIAMATLLIPRIPIDNPVGLTIGLVWLGMAAFLILFFGIGPIVARTRFRNAAPIIPITVTCSPVRLDVSVGGWRTRYDPAHTRIDFFQSFDRGVIVILKDESRKGLRAQTSLALHREEALRMIAHIRSIQTGESGQPETS